MVDSDRNCDDCQAGLEQFCPNVIYTYNSPDKHLGGVTYGGYSDSIVVKEGFVPKFLPNSIQPELRLSCALELQHIPRYATGESPRARRLA
jgi:D-arabinose 1-dehydrogenase-like Zn-dependent alcohol dehydrogenase